MVLVSLCQFILSIIMVYVSLYVVLVWLVVVYMLLYQLCSSCHVVSGFSFAKKKILKEKAGFWPDFGGRFDPFYSAILN